MTYTYIYILKSDNSKYIIRSGLTERPVRTDRSEWECIEYKDSFDLSGLTEISGASLARMEFKKQRELNIRALTVNVGGLVYDADETSRSRMADTIVGLEPLETSLWVLADNSVTYPTREVLKEVLRAIGIAQTAVWVQQ